MPGELRRAGAFLVWRLLLIVALLVLAANTVVAWLIWLIWLIWLG